MSALSPLAYRLEVLGGRAVLAHDPSGHGRIVEVLGALHTAERVAILVPGNAHRLATYLADTSGGSPRANGQVLHRALRNMAPGVRSTVIVWLGYSCPKGLIAGAWRRAATKGSDDLRRLIHHLPTDASVTLIGHSYGSVVCAMAASGTNVDNVVALASPGLGVWHVSELDMSGQLWATRCGRDWVRLLPRLRVAGFGHGRQPTDLGFGAIDFSSHDATGHAGYYAPGTESLRNIARIVLGKTAEVSLSSPRYGAASAGGWPPGHL